MSKICKFLTLIILIVAVLLFGIYQYRTFIQTEIYQENSEHLLATYEQGQPDLYAVYATQLECPV